MIDVDSLASWISLALLLYGALTLLLRWRQTRGGRRRTRRPPQP